MAQSQSDAPAVLPVHIARRALRYWKAAVVVLLLGAAGSLAAVRFTRQVYRSESVILFRSSSREGAESSRRVGARLSDTLLARERLSNIVREFQLFPEAKTPQEAVEITKKAVGFRVRDGSTFVISFDGHSPAATQRVTRRLAEMLIEDSSRQRREENEDTRRFLEGEQRRLEEENAKREGELVAFIKKNPELGNPQAVLETIPQGTGEIFSLQMTMAQLREAERQRIAAGVPTAGPTPGPREPIEQLQTLRNAEQDLQRAQAELAQRRQFMTEANPDVVASRQVVRLAEARATRAREELAKLKATSEENRPKSPAPAAAPTTAPPTGTEESQMALLEQRISELKRSMASSQTRRPRQASPQVELQFQTLRRAVEDVRGRLNQLEERRFQAALAAKLESSGTGQLTVLDPANLPALPHIDMKKKAAALGAAATLLLMLVIVFVRAFSDDRLYDKGDVGWMLSLPVLAIVPGRKAKLRT